MIKIDFNKSSYDTLPPALRTLINYHWVQVLIKPLKENYDIFSGYTFDNDFEIYHNSQTMSFEHYLNTKVTSNYSGVTIMNGNWINMLYSWFQEEIDSFSGSTREFIYMKYQEEVLTGVTTKYIRYQEEIDADTYDFIVYYHGQDLIDNPDYLNELTVWIDKLKLVGTTYKFNEL